MKPISLFKLSSGMPCAFLPTASPVCYTALSTLAGTSFEPEGFGGLAHFCEHLVFKGTQKRKSYHINNRLERVGGEINAFTTKEELVLHATVLREDVDKALDLIADLAFHATVPEVELIKERQVVIDEIHSYNDSPPDLIYDRFEELLFAGTPMATPILGTPQSLKKMHSAQLLRYLKDRFVPAHMALAMVGCMTPKRAQALAERYFGAEALGLQAVAVADSQESLARKEMPLIPSRVFSEEQKRNTYQVHCLMGTTAYPLYNAGRIPLALLMNVLGGPASNARLNMLLREKYGLVYTVEGSYNPYMTTGFAGIYFGTEKTKWEQCCELVRKTLKEYAQVQMSSLQLDRAKKQLIGQLSVSEDNSEAQCLSMGKSLLAYGRVMSHEQMLATIDAVTPADILRVAAEIFAPERQSMVVYL